MPWRVLVCCAGVFLAASSAADCPGELPHSRDPDWSPDGDRLVFDSTRDGQRDIYMVDAADGSNLVRLTADERDNYYPFFSPDGRQIVFMDYSAGSTVVRLMDADGGNPRSLTPVGQVNADPHWSPDGERIVFYRDVGGNDDIFVLDLASGDDRRLTNHPAADQTPVYSPDGRQIVFVSTRDGDAELYLMNADGSGQRNLTRSPETSDRVPDWAPDGRSIIYYARPITRQGPTGPWRAAEIFEFDLATGRRRQLTQNDWRDQSPVYSPDGTEIAYSSCASGRLEIHVMDRQGLADRQVTHTR